MRKVKAIIWRLGQCSVWSNLLGEGQRKWSSYSSTEVLLSVTGEQYGHPSVAKEVRLEGPAKPKQLLKVFMEGIFMKPSDAGRQKATTQRSESAGCEPLSPLSAPRRRLLLRPLDRATGSLASDHVPTEMKMHHRNQLCLGLQPFTLEVVLPDWLPF